MATKEYWIITSRAQDLIDGICHTAFLMSRDQSEPGYWKWSILALHNTLQSSMSLALSGYDSSGVALLDKKSGRALSKYYEESLDDEDQQYPDTRLADFLTLFRRVQSPKYLGANALSNLGHSANFNMRKLVEIRNNFSHFNYDGWSIEISGIPSILSTSLQLLEGLVIERPTFQHRLSDLEIETANKAVKNFRTSVVRVQELMPPN